MTTQVSENKWQAVSKKAFKDRATESTYSGNARYPSTEYAPSKDYVPKSGYDYSSSGSSYQNKQSGYQKSYQPVVYQPTIYSNPKPSYSGQGNQINIQFSQTDF